MIAHNRKGIGIRLFSDARCRVIPGGWSPPIYQQPALRLPTQIECPGEEAPANEFRQPPAEAGAEIARLRAVIEAADATYQRYLREHYMEWPLVELETLRVSTAAYHQRYATRAAAEQAARVK